MNSLDELLASIRERLANATPGLQGIFDVLKKQWGIAEIKLRGTILDQNADIARLIVAVEIAQRALENVVMWATETHMLAGPLLGAEEARAEMAKALGGE